MKTTERIKRNTQPDQPTTEVYFRLPNHVIEDLEEAAKSLGLEGYGVVILAYISKGLRDHFAGESALRLAAIGGSVPDFSDIPRRKIAPNEEEIRVRCLAVEHSMAIEGQAVGNVEALIESEVQRARIRNDAAALCIYYQGEIETMIRQMKIQGATVKDCDAELRLLAEFVQTRANSLKEDWANLLQGTASAALENAG